MGFGGFVQAQRPGRSKTKLISRQFCWFLVYNKCLLSTQIIYNYNYSDDNNNDTDNKNKE